MKKLILVGSWVVGFLALGFFWDTLDLDKGLIGWISVAISIGIGVLTNFVGQWLWVRFSMTHGDYAHLYAQAEEEVEDQTYDTGLWSKALVQCNGDESKRKITYMLLRVAQLRREQEE